MRYVIATLHHKGLHGLRGRGKFGEGEQREGMGWPEGKEGEQREGMGWPEGEEEERREKDREREKCCLGLFHGDTIHFLEVVRESSGGGSHPRVAYHSL